MRRAPLLFLLALVAAIAPSSAASPDAVVYRLSDGVARLTHPMTLLVDLRNSTGDTLSSAWSLQFGDVTVRGNGTTPLACPQGGLFVAGGASSLTLEGVVISGCRRAPAVSGDQSGRVSLANVTIARCDNGAVALSGNARLDATGCAFSGNKALEGADMRLDLGSAASLSNCSFVGGAAVRGGAVFVRSVARLNATGCLFTNYSAEVGGCMYADGQAAVQLSDSLLEGCQATTHGGAVAAVGGANVIAMNHVTVVSASAGFVGGLAYLYGLPESAGGAYALSLFRCNVTSVRADKHGGLVFASGSAHVTVDESEVAFVHAQSGGVLFAQGYGSTVLFSAHASTFTDVVATYVGGIAALFLPTGVVTLTNCTLTDVRSQLYGAIVYADEDHHVTIADGTVQHSGAVDGSCLYLMGGGSILVTRTSFLNVSTQDGGAFRLGSGTSAVLSDVRFDNGHLSAGGGSVLRASGRSDAIVDGLSYRPAVVDMSALSPVHDSGLLFVVDENARLTATRVNVTDIVSYGGGAVVASVKGSATASFDGVDVRSVRCLSSRDVPTFPGALFSASEAATLDIRNAIISDVTSASDGGVFYCTASARVTMTDSRIDNVSTAGSGGVAFITREAYLSMARVSSNGTSAADGGFLSTDNLSNVTFVGQDLSVGTASARGNGGCFVVRTARSFALSDSVFDSCIAGTDPATYGSGGFVYVGDGTADGPHLLSFHDVFVSRVSAPLGLLAFFNPPAIARDLQGIAVMSVSDINALPITTDPTALRVVFNGDGWTPTPDGRAALRRAAGATFGLQVEAIDAFGNRCSISPLRQLSVRLVISHPCDIGGSLVAYYQEPQGAVFDVLTLYAVAGNVSTAKCVLSLTPTNFVYAPDSPLFNFSADLQLESCSGGSTLQRKFVTPPRYTCQFTPQPPVLSLGSSGTAVIAVAVAVPLVSLVALAIGGRFVLARARRLRNRRLQKEFIESHVNKAPELAAMELAPESVKVLDELGSGEFGVVYKAEVLAGGRLRLCAAKTVRADATVRECEEVLAEALLMAPLRSERIIGLIGIVTQSEPLMILLEYAPHGSLKNFIGRFGNPLDLGPRAPGVRRLLLAFSLQIAEGLRYLESMRVVHRDIAARNILVSQDVFGEYAVKVADFGLSRELQGTDYYRKKSGARVPIRWMAPESIERRIFTHASDCWSYGITLWEIFSLGALPYATMRNDKVLEAVKNGLRLDCPDVLCPQALYRLLCECWEARPEDRPSFAAIIADIGAMLDRADAEGGCTPNTALHAVGVESGLAPYGVYDNQLPSRPLAPSALGAPHVYDSDVVASATTPPAGETEHATNGTGLPESAYDAVSDDALSVHVEATPDSAI